MHVYARVWVVARSDWWPLDPMTRGSHTSFAAVSPFLIDAILLITHRVRQLFVQRTVVVSCVSFGSDWLRPNRALMFLVSVFVIRHLDWTNAGTHRECVQHTTCSFSVPCRSVAATTSALVDG